MPQLHTKTPTRGSCSETSNSGGSCLVRVSVPRAEDNFLANTGLLQTGGIIHPLQEDVRVFHEPGGFLELYADWEKKVLFP